MRAACAAVALVDAVVSAAPLGSSGRSSGGDSSGSGAMEQREGQQPGSGQRPGTANAPPVGFSICRPPGHHATPSDQMGFCLLNNAALAARHAQRAHGLRKVGRPPQLACPLLPCLWALSILRTSGS